jgi:hypothetical protein
MATACHQQCLTGAYVQTLPVRQERSESKVQICGSCGSELGSTTEMTTQQHSERDTTQRSRGHPCTRGESVRVDCLIHRLLTFVAQAFVDKDIRRHSRVLCKLPRSILACCEHLYRASAMQSKATLSLTLMYTFFHLASAA